MYDVNKPTLDNDDCVPLQRINAKQTQRDASGLAAFGAHVEGRFFAYSVRTSEA